MLSPDELNQVVDLLVEAVSATADPRASLCAVLGESDFAERLPSLALPRPLIREAVNLCIADSFRSEPPWLLRLLDLAPNVELIATLRKRLKSPPPPVENPLDSTLLSMDLPFLDRTDLRQRLRVLGDQHSLKPVLVVVGPRQSGKSYTSLLIEHYCGAETSLLQCQVALLAGQEEITGAKEVASDLVAQMGGSTSRMPAANTNEERWVRELATWVLSEACATPHDWWIVLDGFNGEAVRPDARKLIVHLADQIHRGVFARRCRLILLDFDRSALTVPPGRILLDEIGPVESHEVVACVAAIVRRTGCSVDVQQTAAAIFQDLPQDEGRMSILNQRLVSLLKAAEELHG